MIDHPRELTAAAAGVPDNAAPAPLLEVRKLQMYYPVRGALLPRRRQWVQAVDDVSFAIWRGETLGLVGESGCGKTTVGKALLRLVEPTAGAIRFEGQDILKLRGQALNDLRRNMQVIFQDPYTSLNPRIPIGVSVAEGLKTHRMGDSRERRARVVEMLRRVGLDEAHADRYPHEFSGGQRQRIGVARALILQPKLVVCDEAVSALDVSIQAQVLNLLKDLQQEFDLTYLFIAHNMNVVEYMADRVAVMYLGKIVEQAPKQALFRQPRHPYTKALLSAIPGPNPYHTGQRIMLEGEMPNPAAPPPGCRFHTRCPVAVARCAVEEPPLRAVNPDHAVACWLA